MDEGKPFPEGNEGSWTRKRSSPPPPRGLVGFCCPSYGILFLFPLHRFSTTLPRDGLVLRRERRTQRGSVDRRLRPYYRVLLSSWSSSSVRLSSAASSSSSLSGLLQGRAAVAPGECECWRRPQTASGPPRKQSLKIRWPERCCSRCCSTAPPHPLQFDAVAPRSCA